MLITLARKPVTSTVAQCCLTHGTGALNIDASRIGTGTGEVKTFVVPDHRGNNYGQDTAAYKDRAKLTIQQIDQGRWPANVLVTIDAAQMLDIQSGITQGVVRKPTGKPIYPTEGTAMVWNPNNVMDKTERGFMDAGGASRYFKQVGASKC